MYHLRQLQSSSRCGSRSGHATAHSSATRRGTSSRNGKSNPDRQSIDMRVIQVMCVHFCLFTCACECVCASVCNLRVCVCVCVSVSMCLCFVCGVCVMLRSILYEAHFIPTPQAILSRYMTCITHPMKRTDRRVKGRKGKVPFQERYGGGGCVDSGGKAPLPSKRSIKRRNAIFHEADGTNGRSLTIAAGAPSAGRPKPCCC